MTGHTSTYHILKLYYLISGTSGNATGTLNGAGVSGSCVPHQVAQVQTLRYYRLHPEESQVQV